MSCLASLFLFTLLVWGTSTTLGLHLAHKECKRLRKDLGALERHQDAMHDRLTYHIAGVS